MAATGAAPQLVRSLKREYNQPNVMVRVSKDVVAGGIDDNLNEKTPIEDNILGTEISGTGDTTGRVTSTLVPSRDNAKIELELKGRTLAHTVGWNGPVTIFAHSTTSLYGRKLLTIDGGAFGGEPACAECCTNSSIDCLDIDGGRLIQRIATKRVYSSKSTAEAISAQHAEARLENRMDTRTGELIARSNAGFNEQFRTPLVRRGAFPQRLEFSTTRDSLNVVGLQARSGELAANTPPPAAANDAAISIRLHESRHRQLHRCRASRPLQPLDGVSPFHARFACRAIRSRRVPRFRRLSGRRRGPGRQARCRTGDFHTALSNR